MPDLPKRGFDVFANADEIQINRLGKNVMIRGRDGTFTESNTAEATPLFEILNDLKRGR